MMTADPSFRGWLTQDFAANSRRPCRLIVAWFRLAQWALTRWGAASSLVLAPYRLFVVTLLGVDLPANTAVGPRLALLHPQGIVVHPEAQIGADVVILHGVTSGTRAMTSRGRPGSGTALNSAPAALSSATSRSASGLEWEPTQSS
jgi:serine acetyltransferase